MVSKAVNKERRVEISFIIFTEIKKQ